MASGARQTSTAMPERVSSVSPVRNMDTTVSNGAAVSNDTTVSMSMESASDGRLLEMQNTKPDENKKQDCDAVDKQRQCSLVTEQGETMATLLEKSDMSLEQFFKMNSCKDVALLPGIAYQK